MPEKPTSRMTRAELVEYLRRFNPFGSYCLNHCKHLGHTTAAYRDSVRRIRGGQ